MPKKTLKKIRSFYRKTPKTARLARFRREQAARQKERSLMREEKALNAILENAERKNEPTSASIVAPNSINNENGENNIHSIEFQNEENLYNTPAFIRGKRFPSSRKVKQAKMNLLRTRKQKQRLQNLGRAKAREGKELERVLETVNLENLPKNKNAESMTSKERDKLEWNAMVRNMVRNAEEQERLLEEMAAKEKTERLEQAKKEMDKLPKNTFYIRFDYQKRLYKASYLIEILNKGFLSFGTMDLLYLSEEPEKSYARKLKWFFEEEEEYYNDFNNNNYFGRSRYRQPDAGYKVYKMDPLDFFKAKPEALNSYYLGEYLNNNNDVNYVREVNLLGRYATLLRTNREVKQYLLGLPYFADKVKAEERAVFTTPAKLESLQLKGLEGSVKQFEKKTGTTVPRNAQNIIERYLMRRPPPSTYFQQRDNIYRIDPNLFTEGEVNMPRHLKKIHTDVLNKSL